MGAVWWFGFLVVVLICVCFLFSFWREVCCSFVCLLGFLFRFWLWFFGWLVFVALILGAFGCIFFPCIFIMSLTFDVFPEFPWVEVSNVSDSAVFLIQALLTEDFGMPQLIGTS